MQNLTKQALGFLLILIVGIALNMAIIGCDENKKEVVYHWKVFQEKADGNYVMWTMPDEPKRDEGFICWTRADGTKICVGGNVNYESFVAGVK